MSEWLDFTKTVGVPTGIAFFVLWRLDRRLADLVSATRDLVVRLKPMEDQAAHIIREVDHNMRGALATYAIRRRDDGNL
jgi:hypothetical protein